MTRPIGTPMSTSTASESCRRPRWSRARRRWRPVRRAAWRGGRRGRGRRWSGPGRSLARRGDDGLGPLGTVHGHHQGRRVVQAAALQELRRATRRRSRSRGPPRRPASTSLASRSAADPAGSRGGSACRRPACRPGHSRPPAPAAPPSGCRRSGAATGGSRGRCRRSRRRAAGRAGPAAGWQNIDRVEATRTVWPSRPVDHALAHGAGRG